MSADSSWIEADFEALVLPELFRAANSSADPVWIGIGGQPGAGKTAGRQMALRLVDDDQVVPIIGDDLRPLHRSYRELMATAPLLMPERTQDAVSAWVERALEYAARERISTLVEGTFRRPEVTLSTAQRFRDAGFRTHLVAVAVPGWESRLSTVERFVHDHREGRAARWTPNEAHDAGLVGTPATLRAAAAPDSPVDRISVVTRRGDVLFDQHRPDDLHGAAVALQAEQRRTPSAAVQREWELRRRAVVEYLAREVPRTSETAASVAALRADALRWESTSGPLGGVGPGWSGSLSLG